MTYALDVSIGVGPASRPIDYAYVKYSRGLFRSMDSLERLSRKASTPRGPYRTLNQPYMSRSARFHPNANAYVKYSRGLFRSMDGLERLSRKASTPRRPYRTLNQPYMSQSGRFHEYPKTCNFDVQHKVILTYPLWDHFMWVWYPDRFTPG